MTPTDIHAELKRVAARARKAMLAAWPVGAVVEWTDSFRRTLHLTGEVQGVFHCRGDGSVEVRVRVTAERSTSKEKSLWSEVGRHVEVKPARLVLVAPAAAGGEGPP